jgi:paraquat-inducible protein B
MGKRVSPTAIGVFVVSAIAIALIAIVVVGSGKMFRKPSQFICMFQGNLNGLKVGAAVKFRGVQIGSVSAIRLNLPPGYGKIRADVSQTRLPVILDLDSSELQSQGGTGEALTQAGLQQFIQRGLRAQLEAESLLTGLKYIDLDLHPDAPLDLVLEPDSGPYREVPTIPTTLENVQEQATLALAKLENIDFKALVESITSAANSINRITSSPSLRATMDSMKETTANLNKTVISMKSVLDSANKKIGPLVTVIEKTSQETNLTLQQTRATLVELQATLDPDSPMAVHLNDALEEMAATSRQMGELSAYLHRNPGSLVRGRYVSDKTQ